jgi:hypothetical protein
MYFPDYNAPLSEAGDYSPMYFYTAGIFDEYENPKLRRPLRPPQSVKASYGVIPIHSYLSYDDMIDRVPEASKVILDSPVTMEELPINDNNGQSYGYIVYRATPRSYNSTDTYKVC